MTCERPMSGDLDLYFYDELPADKREELGRHLSGCEDCRAALDELHAIRAATNDVQASILSVFDSNALNPGRCSALRINTLLTTERQTIPLVARMERSFTAPPSSMDG